MSTLLGPRIKLDLGLDEAAVSARDPSSIDAMQSFS
jgi:hypothetical protein